MTPEERNADIIRSFNETARVIEEGVTPECRKTREQATPGILSRFTMRVLRGGYLNPLQGQVVPLRDSDGNDIGIVKLRQDGNDIVGDAEVVIPPNGKGPLSCGYGAELIEEPIARLKAKAK